MIKFAILIFVCGLSLGSVYIFDAGLPQPGDIVLALFSVIVLSYSMLKKKSVFRSVPLVWMALVLWVFLVCLIWSLILGAYDLFNRFLFWFYNFMVASSVAFLLVEHGRFRDHLQFALCVSLIVSGVGVALSLGSSARSLGFFNNPNQLAYFSLLGISSLLVILRFQIPMNPLIVAAFLSGLLGIFAGASLGAMAGLISVVAAYLLANVSPKRLIRATLGCFLLSAFLIVADFQIVQKVNENVSRRMLVAETKFSGLSSGRNYDRILAFPEYTIFGAGEGHLDRFYPYNHLEIHSSFGNLLFCYGVVGLGLFLILLYKILRYTPFPVWLSLGGPLVYSLTHMGLRMTMFWILLAIIWSEYGVKRNQYPKVIPPKSPQSQK